MVRSYIIYKITNKLNGKSYIGLTHRGLDIRINEHTLESKKDKDKHFHFHMAIQKYGVNNFSSEVLVDSINTLIEANQLEIFHIKHFDTYKNGYNMTKGGGGRDNYFFSYETKKKMRKAKLGGTLSEEHKTKISKSLKGKSKTKEHNKKVSEALIGHKCTEESKKKISETLRGKFAGDKNPAAITVEIFNKNGILQFICCGDFEKTCNKNGLPTIALRESYYNYGKPIYSGRTIKKSVLLKNKEFIGWYAVKIGS